MTDYEALDFIRSFIDLDVSEAEVYAQCERVKRMLEHDIDSLDVDGLIAKYLHTHYHN